MTDDVLEMTDEILENGPVDEIFFDKDDGTVDIYAWGGDYMIKLIESTKEIIVEMKWENPFLAAVTPVMYRREDLKNVTMVSSDDERETGYITPHKMVITQREIERKWRRPRFA